MLTSNIHTYVSKNSVSVMSQLNMKHVNVFTCHGQVQNAEKKYVKIYTAGGLTKITVYIQNVNHIKYGFVVHLKEMVAELMFMDK